MGEEQELNWKYYWKGECFSDVTPYSLVDMYKRFRRNTLPLSTMKVDVVGTSETLVNVYQTIRRHVTEEH
jgi:hypothetical protein